MAINKLLKDKLFRVYKDKELIMTICNENAANMFDDTYQVVSVVNNEDIETNELIKILNETKVSIYDVLKTPHELLQEIIGDDYLIQPLISNEKYTTYVVGENGFDLSFTIKNSQYYVFEVCANGSGVFFTNRYLVKQWYDFLCKMEAIRDIIYSLKLN